MLPQELVDVLVCPKSKEQLIYFPRGEKNDDETAGFLVCPKSRLRYRIEHGVPVMLAEEAMELPLETVERLLTRARELGFGVR